MPSEEIFPVRVGSAVLPRPTPTRNEVLRDRAKKAGFEAELVSAQKKQARKSIGGRLSAVLGEGRKKIALRRNQAQEAFERRFAVAKTRVGIFLNRTRMTLEERQNAAEQVRDRSAKIANMLSDSREKAADRR